MKMRGIGTHRYFSLLFDSQVYCRISAMQHLGLSTGIKQSWTKRAVDRVLSRCDVTNKTEKKSRQIL